MKKGMSFHLITKEWLKDLTLRQKPFLIHIFHQRVVIGMLEKQSSFLLKLGKFI